MDKSRFQSTAVWCNTTPNQAWGLWSQRLRPVRQHPRRIQGGFFHQSAKLWNNFCKGWHVMELFLTGLGVDFQRSIHLSFTRKCSFPLTEMVHLVMNEQKQENWIKLRCVSPARTVSEHLTDESLGGKKIWGKWCGFHPPPLKLSSPPPKPSKGATVARYFKGWFL